MYQLSTKFNCILNMILSVIQRTGKSQPAPEEVQSREQKSLGPVY